MKPLLGSPMEVACEVVVPSIWLIGVCANAPAARGRDGPRRMQEPLQIAIHSGKAGKVNQSNCRS